MSYDDNNNDSYSGNIDLNLTSFEFTKRCTSALAPGSNDNTKAVSENQSTIGFTVNAKVINFAIECSHITSKPLLEYIGKDFYIKKVWIFDW